MLSITGHTKAMEYIKSVRATETIEKQAKAYYEICLVLNQKLESFKETLHDVYEEKT